MPIYELKLSDISSLLNCSSLHSKLVFSIKISELTFSNGLRSNKSPPPLPPLVSPPPLPRPQDIALHKPMLLKVPETENRPLQVPLAQPRPRRVH